MKLTDEQAEIVDAARDLDRPLRIRAFAGTGKTTTLLAIARTRKTRGARGLYLAFNRSIAEESQPKFAGTGVTARTMHALARRAVGERVRELIPGRARCVMDAGVLRRIPVPQGWNMYRLGGAVARTMAGYCASDDPEITRDHAVAALTAMVGDPETLPPGPARGRASAATRQLADGVTEMTRDWLAQSEASGTYTHDMYLKALERNPALCARAFAGQQYVMIDEAQDLNPVQSSILEQSGLPLVAVGDSYQQIYAWRGAEDALDRFGGDEFLLTGSFRFGAAVARAGMDILASRPDGGPDQALRGLGPGPIEGWVGPKGGVICRTNAGVIEASLDLSARGLSIHIDNFDHIVTEVESLDALRLGRREEIRSQAVQRFASWEEACAEAEYGPDGEMARLVTLVEDDGLEQIRGLERWMQRAGEPVVTICTGHRSKGLEWPAVRLWSDFTSIDELHDRFSEAHERGRLARVQAMEAWNVCYVAATRAMYRLVLSPDLQASLKAETARRQAAHAPGNDGPGV
ncbi:MAG: UvrD-helicase domain-containing protein [Alphaproteobacteria bacterium]|nr:UvrD-helicase domain-containing protein [Alphaproteobacteria bacterium]